MKMKFKSWDCIVEAMWYGNHRRALRLIDAEDCEPIAVATVNIIDYPCPDDCAYIKEYSENNGMTKALIEAGLIEPEMINSVPSGHVMIGMYKLTDKALDLYLSRES